MGQFFFVDLVAQYLIIKISYNRFPVKLFINEYSTHYDEQFSGGLIKISQNIKNLTVFLTELKIY